jgi:hypothetical protein
MSIFKSILNDICTCLKKEKNDENSLKKATITRQNTKKFENLVIKVQERKVPTKHTELDKSDDYFITRFSDIHFQVKNMYKKSNVLDYELVSFNEKVSIPFFLTTLGLYKH